jgi:hypothetical protein
MNSIQITHKDNFVIVPLAHSDKTATVDAADFETLMARGVSPRWKLSQAGKVMVGANKTVARLIANAQRGQWVKYLDSDPTNLRRSNLILSDYSYRLLDVKHSFEDHTRDQGKTVTLGSGDGKLEPAQ